MKYLMCIILALSLSGCASLKDSFCDYSMIPASKPIEIDPKLLEECESFVLPVLPLTWESLLNNAKENKLIHLTCIKKQKDSIIVLKKFSNNK